MTAAVLGLLLSTMFVLRPSGAALQGLTQNAGNSAAADQLQPPTSPSATYSCVLATRRVDLTWTASASSAATHYRVYKSTWNSTTSTWGAATPVATVAFGTNSWTDTSVAGGAQFRYRLDSTRSATTWVSAPSTWSNSINSPTLCI